MFQRIVNWSREKNHATINIELANRGTAVAVWSTDLLLIVWCIAILIFGRLGYLPSPIFTVFIVTSIIFLIVIAFFGLISIE